MAVELIPDCRQQVLGVNDWLPFTTLIENEAYPGPPWIFLLTSWTNHAFAGANTSP